MKLFAFSSLETQGPCIDLGAIDLGISPCILKLCSVEGTPIALAACLQACIRENSFTKLVSGSVWVLIVDADSPSRLLLHVPQHPSQHLHLGIFV